MERLQSTDPDLPKGLLSLVLGFVGVTAVILFLPKTIKYMIRRFVFGLVGEIVAVVISGLLTEKVVGLVAREHPATNGRVREATPRTPAASPRPPAM